MKTDALKQISHIIDKYSDKEGIANTAIDCLHFYKVTTAGVRTASVYTPCVCFIVQGSKEMTLENEVYKYSDLNYLAVSVELPATGCVVTAKPEKPYMCVQVDIDPIQISDIISKSGIEIVPETATDRGVFVGEMDEGITDSVLRLVKLLDSPQDAQFLAPLVTAELFYRLLTSPNGRRIAKLAVAGGNMQKIAEVIKNLKTNLSKSFSVEELAQMANMSQSTFHHHFKEVTAMSPLQFQKKLRLTEARRIMIAETADAASTAYRVGYESPSQFSREYSRMFGAPPAADAARMRAGLTA